MDDKSKPGEPDRSRINIHEPYEVAYWTKELNVTAEQLKNAVNAVGPMVKDVRRYLGK
jgi:hypothetical protein